VRDLCEQISHSYSAVEVLNVKLIKHFSVACVVLTAFLTTQPALAGKPAAPVAAAPLKGADFTDSNAAGLAGTKRVAITSVILSFQASTGATKGPHPFFQAFQQKEEVLAVLAMPTMSQDLQDALAASAYQQLSKSLTEAGFEVVPQEQVTASATYQAILKQSGYANHSRFGNMLGEVTLVAPAGLAPYGAYSGETGQFFSPNKSYLGWFSAFGQKSTTPGGPSAFTMGNAWKVPGMEVALARELNAHVVKAIYVISLGTTSAKRKTGFDYQAYAGTELWGNSYDLMTHSVEGNANAFAQVGLVPDYSHIAFRTPGGNAKWQKVSMMKAAPPKDGDVVVRLGMPLLGSTDFFSLTRQSSVKSGGLLGGLGSGKLFTNKESSDININDIAVITDETRYGKEVAGMIRIANHAMLELVKQ
jgi:hypothetical protein